MSRLSSARGRGAACWHWADLPQCQRWRVAAWWLSAAFADGSVAAFGAPHTPEHGVASRPSEQTNADPNARSYSRLSDAPTKEGQAEGREKRERRRRQRLRESGERDMNARKGKGQEGTRADRVRADERCRSARHTPMGAAAASLRSPPPPPPTALDGLVGAPPIAMAIMLQ